MASHQRLPCSAQPLDRITTDHETSEEEYYLEETEDECDGDYLEESGEEDEAHCNAQPTAGTDEQPRSAPPQSTAALNDGLCAGQQAAVGIEAAALYNLAFDRAESDRALH